MSYHIDQLTLERRHRNASQEIVTDCEGTLRFYLPSRLDRGPVASVQRDSLAEVLLLVEQCLDGIGFPIAQPDLPVEQRWHCYDEDLGLWSVCVNAGTDNLVTCRIQHASALRTVSAWEGTYP